MHTSQFISFEAICKVIKLWLLYLFSVLFLKPLERMVLASIAYNFGPRWTRKPVRVCVRVCFCVYLCGWVNDGKRCRQKEVVWWFISSWRFTEWCVYKRSSTLDFLLINHDMKCKYLYFFKNSRKQKEQTVCCMYAMYVYWCLIKLF